MTIPVSIDKYQVIKPLGAGNFGQVYQVVDRALGVDKAVKVLAAADPSEFMQKLEEAQILRKCQHKHIVPINEANIFSVSGEPRVVLDLEYIPEGSLEGALANRWVSAKDSVKCIRGALLGLEHAHNQGFLHRDVKPGNILLDPTAPKLSDFGLATEVGANLVGSARGYRPHLPPEYYSSLKTTVQTDVYAVGVTLFRSLSNISDWRAVIQAIPNLMQHMNSGKLITKIGFESFIPPTLQRIVKKACHADPTKRFETAGKFGQSLDRIRFNIDWIRLDDYSWQGYCEKAKRHECLVDIDSIKVEVKVNGRRARNECKSFAKLADAVSYQQEYISKTTLR